MLFETERERERDQWLLEAAEEFGLVSVNWANKLGGLSLKSWLGHSHGVLLPLSFGSDAFLHCITCVCVSSFFPHELCPYDFIFNIVMLKETIFWTTFYSTFIGQNNRRKKVRTQLEYKLYNCINIVSHFRFIGNKFMHSFLSKLFSIWIVSHKFMVVLEVTIFC